MKNLLIILLSFFCINASAQRILGGVGQDIKIYGNIYGPNIDSVPTTNCGCLAIDTLTHKIHRIKCTTSGGGSSQWIDTTGAIFYSLGNVGIGGRFIPLNALDVRGTADVSGGLYVVATTTTGLSEKFRVFSAATSGSILAAFGDANNKSLYIGSTGTASNYFGWNMPANVHFIASDYDGGGPFADIGIITGEQARVIFKASGNVGIGNMTPAASSALDITSTTGGLLIPRMTTTQRNAISSPATGLEIFNTTTGQFEFYNGSAWVAVGGGGTSLTIGALDSLSKSTNGIQLAGTKLVPQTVDATHPGFEDTATYKLIDSIKTGSYDLAHPFVLKTDNAFNIGGSRMDSLYLNVDTASAILGISSRTVFTQTAFQTIANSTSETPIIGTGVGSNIFSANYFTVGKTIVIKGFGKISTASSAGNLTYKFLNSSSGPTVTLTPGNSLSNAPVEYEFTGTVTATGNISTGLITLAGWLSINNVKSYFEPLSFAFDTTTGQTFTVDIIWSTASTSNSITGTNCVTEIKK